MKEQLIQYVELLFAGMPDCEDIKQEILQNTLDRYDDLIAEGKVPEAAYRLAIAGIGDISELLADPRAIPAGHTAPEAVDNAPTDTPVKKLLRAIAVGLYIVCPLPLFVLSELGMSTIGLCGLLAIVAVATVLIILGAKKENGQNSQPDTRIPRTPQQELRFAIKKGISTVGLVLYFIISFSTGAWFITWLVFPIEAAVWGLVKAILDLKEAVNYEN